MKKILFFDLDGTLTDPGVGITNSVAYALRKFGIEAPEREKLYSFIGPPLYDSFREIFGPLRFVSLILRWRKTTVYALTDRQFTFRNMFILL